MQPRRRPFRTSTRLGGPYDLVGVVEAPDGEAATACLLCSPRLARKRAWIEQIGPGYRHSSVVAT